MRQRDEATQPLLAFTEKALGLSASQRSSTQIGGEDIAEFDEHEPFAFPFGVSPVQRVSIRGPISFDQQVREDIRIDDDHRVRQRSRQSRPAAIAVSMSSMVSGGRFLSRTGLGGRARGAS